MGSCPDTDIDPFIVLLTFYFDTFAVKIRPWLFEGVKCYALYRSPSFG